MRPISVPPEAMQVRPDGKLVRAETGEMLAAGDAYFVYYQPSADELATLADGGVLELARVPNGVALNVRNLRGGA